MRWTGCPAGTCSPFASDCQDFFGRVAGHLQSGTRQLCLWRRIRSPERSGSRRASAHMSRFCKTPCEPAIHDARACTGSSVSHPGPSRVGEVSVARHPQDEGGKVYRCRCGGCFHRLARRKKGLSGYASDRGSDAWHSRRLVSGFRQLPSNRDAIAGGRARSMSGSRTRRRALLEGVDDCQSLWRRHGGGAI